MDDLSQELSNTNVGCYHNNVYINHLSYADDCTSGVFTKCFTVLADICERYAKKYEMVYNAKKTACMVVYPKCIKKTCLLPCT